MKSLTEDPVGNDKLEIVLNFPGVFLGTIPTGLVRKFGKVIVLKGPAMRPAWISF